MSNEPTVRRLLAQSPAADTTPADAANSDAEKKLAAFGRMQTALHGGPDAIERMRAELGEMAKVVAQIRLAVDAELDCDLGALLRDLETRTERLMEFVSPPPEAVEAVAASAAVEPPARPFDEQAFLDALGVNDEPEPERVPTVSGVVSNLGRAPDVEAANATDQAAGGNQQTTTVAMLEAMVEELAAAMPAAPPRSEAAETKPAEASASRDPMGPDVDLLASLARMKAMPFLPPEVGTAVIFEAKAKPESKVAEATPPDPAPVAASEPPACSEPILIMLPLDPIETVTESEPTVETSQPLETPAQADAVPGDVDLDALLFEPPAEPEPDPAAFLLEPAPWPTHAPPAQTAEPASESEPTTDPQDSWTLELPSPASISPPERPVFLTGTGHDPLAPLKAMSDEEKIALFE